MAQMTLEQKLAVLSDAAKYDASCASSGTTKRNSATSGGLGSTEGGGICHAYAPDGRCISLLKILMTNFCIYDCAYCVNRVSSNVVRARFTPEEIVTLTIEFYRRNYIEGLFLSSGIIRNPDYTMEQMILVARSLRQEHGFRGYIHLKTIPNVSHALITEAGLLADRLSINIELPTDSAIGQYAPEKNPTDLKRSMASLKSAIDDHREPTLQSKTVRHFAPAGQSTQMIIGADQSSDATVLQRSAALYSSYGLKRVYYSAFSPIPDSSRQLPLVDPPLMREHRLYQADWLMRFYGFSFDEIAGVAPSGMLDLTIDPKLAWALANRHLFPLDINKAPKEMLLRVPGLGTKCVPRILAARRQKRLAYDDLVRLGARLSKAKPFITLPGWSPGALADADNLRARFSRPAEQLQLL